MRPWFVATILSAAVAAAAGIALLHLRAQTLTESRADLTLLATALTSDADRGLEGIEDGMKAISLELRENRLRVEPGAMSPTLKTHADLMPIVDSLWLVDDRWNVISASDDSPVPPRSTLPADLATPGSTALVLGRPSPPSSTEGARIPLALRFEDPSAHLRGWIVGAVPQASLLGSFSRGRGTPDLRIAVYRADGARLAGHLSEQDANAEAEISPRVAEATVGNVHRLREGTPRFAAVDVTRHYHVKVVVTRDVDELLAAWRGTAVLIGIGVIGLAVIIAGSVFLLQRANQRRIDAQAALQIQMSRAGRLESLGTLAGGVAHDFNNVLAAIIGFGEMAQDSAPPESAQANQLGRLLQAALRGKALVERILLFSRGGARESIVFEIEPLVEEVLTMLSASLPPGIVLERELSAPGAAIRGDPTRAFEAVMNLCTNAIHAMPAGGMLSVRMQRAAVEQARGLSHGLLAPGRYIAVAVADEGTGITLDVMDKLFEPFFTTKGARKGTGLGLSVVHGVISELGGAIDVDSRQGSGTCFTIFLPEARETAVDHARPPMDRVPNGVGQRLLVVDDEPGLAELAHGLLTSLGYAPTCFTQPSDLLAALRADPGGFQGVLTDEIMPGMTGTQLAREIRKLAPALPIVLVSGYGGAALAQRAAEAGIDTVLTKPLQRSDLARVLYEQIDPDS